ncbi:MAG: alpha-amylase family protein [Clostridia bacterium]|nr:alpha-amylase family protein [Clostridia bacterium]
MDIHAIPYEDRQFVRRYTHHLDELRWLYMELYSDEHAFDWFSGMLYRLWKSRPEDLRKLDTEREARPDWYKGHDMVGMQMYVSAFAGTLKGVEEKIPYLQECGVNYVHLMPLLKSPEGRSDGGYAVADFRTVEPALGTMDDLYGLSQACHREGISLCLDFVMNHTSEDHEWALKAKQGEKEYQDRYFFFDDWKIPGQYEQTVPQVFPTTAPGNFTFCEAVGKPVMTTFYPYQWDLNYRNPTVFNDMCELMLNLCNHGIDILRLDATPYIWKELGTSCRNLPQVHTLVRMMRMVCEIVCPGTLLLGEIVMEPSKVVPYFGTLDKPECHMLYNVTTMASTWHTVATGDTRLLLHQLEQVFSLPKEYIFLNYLRCHDDIGWGLDYPFLMNFAQEEVPHKRFLNDYFTGKFPGSPARGELYNDDPRLGDARLCGTTASLCGIQSAREKGDQEALVRALNLDLMLHAYMLTLSGIPVLYSGDEIGQENDETYHLDPLKADDSRYLHRGTFDWGKAELRSDPTTVQGALFGGIRHLEELRRTTPVFDGSAQCHVLETGQDALLGIARYSRGQQLIALFNFSEEPLHTWLNDERPYLDLIHGTTQRAVRVTVPAGDFLWLLHTGKAETRK